MKAMSLAANTAGIGLTKAYQLWGDWMKSDQMVLPTSYAGAKRAERMKKVGKEWCGPIRDKVINIYPLLLHMYF